MAKEPSIYWYNGQLNCEHIKLMPKSFMNFSGREARNKQGKLCNEEGKRNFWIEVPEEFISIFEEENVNMRMLVNTLEDDGYPKNARVKVNVAFNGKEPAKLYLRDGIKDADGEYTEDYEEISKDEVSVLDGYRYEEADLILNVSRINEIHALYLVNGYFTKEYDSNPIKEKHAQQIRRPQKAAINDEPLPFT